MPVHQENHFQGSRALRDIVIGMSDGLTVPFALAAGLSGAQLSNSIILTAGISELVAGAIAMGLGGYLAGRSEVEHFFGELSRESAEIETIPEVEKSEVKRLLSGYGISETTQNQFVVDLIKEKANWLDFMMKFELGLERPKPNEVTYGALRIGASYGFGGIIPLSGYYFSTDPRMGLLISSVITICSLGIFGFLKSRFLGQPAIQGALRVVFVGVLAAGAAFVAARMLGP